MWSEDYKHKSELLRTIPVLALPGFVVPAWGRGANGG